MGCDMPAIERARGHKGAQLSGAQRAPLIVAIVEHMGGWQRIITVLGVVTAAVVVASLPVEEAGPDADTSRRPLLRILDDGNWELWHGSTRLTRARVAVSPMPLTPQGQPNVRPALEALETALADLQVEVRVAGGPPLNGLRIEVAPLQPALTFVQAALLGSRLGLQEFELSADGRRSSIPIGVLPRDVTFMEDETERLAHSLTLDEQIGSVFSVVLQLHTTTWEEDADTPHDFELSTDTDRIVDWTTALHPDGRMALLPDPLLDTLTGVEHGLHRPRRITLSVVPRDAPTLSSRTVLDLLEMIVEQTPHAIELAGFSLVRFTWTRGE